MPYIYAIEVHSYPEGISLEQQKHAWPIKTEYHLVPKDVAEVHEDGCYKLVSNYGQDATSWNHFWPETRALDTTKIGTGKPLCDAIGNELAGGDFVMISASTTATMQIAEVVNFTPKKIRVRDVGGFGTGTAKSPTDVIKVDKSHFF
jgi:hypothetical protein